MSYHLLCRNGHYYYHIKIPVDLKQHFPSPVLKKSLKTSDVKAARLLAVSLAYDVQQTFALIRSGMLPEDMVQGMVAELYPKRKVVKVEEITLAVLMAGYEKVNQSKWTHKTKIEIQGCHRLIQDVIGNVEVKAIKKQVVLDFKDRLLRLPANMYKIYPGKSIAKILSFDNITPMSTTSVNKHILRLNALLGYAVKEGIVTTNYAQGMMIPEKRRSDEERKAYTVADIKKMVEALPRDPGKPEKFWIPLIACQTGLRLDEICQLYVEDVQQVDGVWCISVNDEKDKKVKSLSGKRVVPLHPALLSSGLLRYVESLKVSGVPRLWMNLKWREADGYSNAFGKWFQRFNREYVTDDPQKVFHSMRHLVTDSMKQAGVQEIVIAEIIGHANDSMTTGRYGKRYQPKVLLEALMQLDYGVELPVWEI